MKKLIWRTNAVTWGCAVLLGGVGVCWAQPAITLSIIAGPPKTTISRWARARPSEGDAFLDHVVDQAALEQLDSGTAGEAQPFRGVAPRQNELGRRTAADPRL